MNSSGVHRNRTDSLSTYTFADENRHREQLVRTFISGRRELPQRRGCRRGKARENSFSLRHLRLCGAFYNEPLFNGQLVGRVGRFIDGRGLFKRIDVATANR
jgi:hypothetical protein